MDPPPYAEGDRDRDATSDVLQPVILVLAGHFIHSESANSAPLYELSRGISSLSHTDQSVTFLRLEHNVKTSQDGNPRIVRRDRHIFDLKHPPNAISTSKYAFHIQSVSKRTLGNVGLKKSHKSRHGFKAMQINRTGNDDNMLFEIRQKSKKYEWIDFNGRPVAVEDGADEQYRLVVTAALQQETLDALVALWCLRIWHDSAEEREEPLRWTEGKALET
ncbi:hypothetical protein F4775DRAFT_570408 [Biscogniauxia sp. FL1348]|nr:hypothetical protein F4775DRAFT_570408 [Biscogniauxia sp. FL1348]